MVIEFFLLGTTLAQWVACFGASKMGAWIMPILG